jgi:hypothetical protein
VIRESCKKIIKGYSFRFSIEIRDQTVCKKEMKKNFIIDENFKLLTGVLFLSVSLFAIVKPDNSQAITFMEVETGGVTDKLDPNTVTTSDSLAAVDNHLYLATVATNPGSTASVDSVYGLGLTWALVKAQCTGQNRQRVEVWKALGSPTGNGIVSADISNPGGDTQNVVIAVSRYCGVDTINPTGNVVSANTNGVDGACSGGTNSDTYSVDLTTTSSNSFAYGAVAIKEKIHTPGAGYTERVEFHYGMGADTAGVALEDSSISSSSTVAVNGTFDSPLDWAVIGVEIMAGTLSIQSVSRDTANGDIILTWMGCEDAIYDVFYADSIEGTFTDVADDTATGDTVTWKDDGTQTPNHPDSIVERHYRFEKQKGNTSVNTVGKFTITLQDSAMNLVSIPFVPYSIDIDTVMGTQLTGALSELNADRIWKWIPDTSKYRIAWLVSGGPYDGRWWDSETDTFSTMTLDADDGFWIQNRHGTQKVTFCGKVSDTPDRVIPLRKGMQHIGSAYPVEVLLTDSDLKEDGAMGAINELNADRIWEWDPSTEEYIIAWLIDGIGPPYDGKWWDSSTGSETTIKLRPGVGYWFQIRNLPGHNDFTWTYPKPYTQPPN